LRQWTIKSSQALFQEQLFSLNNFGIILGPVSIVLVELQQDMNRPFSPDDIFAAPVPLEQLRTEIQGYIDAGWQIDCYVHPVSKYIRWQVSGPVHNVCCDSERNIVSEYEEALTDSDTIEEENQGYELIDALKACFFREEDLTDFPAIKVMKKS
jgi:hypothetical protein